MEKSLNDLKNKYFNSPSKRKEQSNICSLFIAGKSEPLPLKNLEYTISIYNSISKITLKQTYYNNFDNSIETEYLFAINPKACFDEFSAQIKGKTIKGIIKEKEQVEKEYKEHLEKGDTVAKSSIMKEANDIMKINIGNIPAKETIVVTFSYVEQLQVCVNKFWRCVIPSTFTPRYQSNINSEMIDIESEPEPYSWKISGTIQSNSEITFLKFVSHDFFINYNESKTIANFTFSQDKEFPNKDFVVLYRNKDVNQPQILISQNTNTKFPFCAMISFFPNFNENSIEDAYNAYMIDTGNNNYKQNMKNASGEYIFVLDCSGSMSGRRIETAKNALIFFVKSLPNDSYFNVYFFGSNFYPMFKESERYSDKNVKGALDIIESKNADMGGTEIFSVLSSVYSVKPLKHYPKSIFLLTDGDIGDTESVLNLIEKNSKTSRIYSIGIGTGCSKSFIEDIAFVGKGKSELILEQNENLEEKVIYLLNDSITKFLEGFSLQYPSEYVELAIPKNIKNLRKNECFSVCLLLKQEAKGKNIAITCEYFDSILRKTEKLSCDLDFAKEIEENESLFKLAIHRLIQDLEFSIKFEDKFANDEYFAKCNSIEKELIDLSLTYQILNPFTAFFCLIEENNKQNLEKAFYISLKIPNLKPQFYQSYFSKGSFFGANDTSQKSGGLAFLNQKSWHCANLPNIESEWKKSNLTMYNQISPTYCAENSYYQSYSPILQNKSIINSNITPTRWDKEPQYNITPIHCTENSNYQSMSPSNFVLEDECKGDSNHLEKTIKRSEKVVKMEKKKKVKLEKIIDDPLLEMIKLQKTNGFWKFKANVFKILKLEKKKILKDYAKYLQNKLEKNAFITVLVLVWLDTKYSERKASWKLIEQKTLDFLQENNFEFDNLKKIVINLL